MNIPYFRRKKCLFPILTLNISSWTKSFISFAKPEFSFINKGRNEGNSNDELLAKALSLNASEPSYNPRVLQDLLASAQNSASEVFPWFFAKILIFSRNSAAISKKKWKKPGFSERSTGCLSWRKRRNHWSKRPSWTFGSVAPSLCISSNYPRSYTIFPQEISCFLRWTRS